MATLVGTQKDFLEALKELLELEYDAMSAYQAAIDRFENEGYKTQLSIFKQDHERHVKEITTALEKLGQQAPDHGSIKRFLTQGKVVIGNLIGDEGILRAMRSNEEEINQAYERMLTYETIPDEPTKSVLQSALGDEKRHLAWIVETIESR